MHSKSRFSSLILPKIGTLPVASNLTSLNSLDEIVEQQQEEQVSSVLPKQHQYHHHLNYHPSSRDDLASQEPPPNEQRTPLLGGSPSLGRRGNSLRVFKQIELLRIKRSEKEGFLQPANFQVDKKRSSLLRGIHERNAKLTEILEQKASKIDLTSQEIQQLSVEIARKAIKSQAEIQFILRVFHENGVFSQLTDFLKHHKSIVIDINYEFHEKNSVIYETGDFAQKYYLMLQGRLAQLLPASSEIVNSPTKLSYPHERKKLQQIQMQSTSQRSGQSSSNNDNSSTNSPRAPFDQFIAHHIFNKEILPGTHFGETELLSRRRRGFSIFCSEDSHMLSISKEVFERIMGNEKSKLIREKLEFFKQFDFLHGVGDTKLMDIIDTSVLVTMNHHQEIYDENSEADSIYFIVSGEVQISKINDVNQPAGSQSQINVEAHFRKHRRVVERVPIHILAANNYFGEREVIHGAHTRDTMAVCSSISAQILVIQAKKLIKLVKLLGRYDLLVQRESSRQALMESRLSLINTQKQEQSELRLKLGFQAPHQVSTSGSPNLQGKLVQSSSQQQFSWSPQSNSPHSKGGDNSHTPSHYQQKLLFKGRISALKNKSESQIPLNINVSATGVATSAKINYNQAYYLGDKRTQSQTTPLAAAGQTFYSKKNSRRQLALSYNSLDGMSQPAYSQNKMNSTHTTFNQIVNGLEEDPSEKRNKRNIFHINSMQSISSVGGSARGEADSIQKNLFQTFVENAEKKIIEKQAMLNKLIQPSQNSRPQNLFEPEFDKGFNQMYLRKFGKHFQKK